MAQATYQMTHKDHVYILRGLVAKIAFGDIEKFDVENQLFQGFAKRSSPGADRVKVYCDLYSQSWYQKKR